jgi:hypothetical protein
MRVMSVLKVAFVAAAVTLPASLPAAAKKWPPGTCLFGRHAVANGALCSYNCNPTTQWCAQQLCSNGTLVQVLPCWGKVCSAKCP